jgi:hypothetical protein
MYHSQQIIFGGTDNAKVELKNVKLVKNSYGYCLDVTYHIEDDAEIRELHIPYLQLPLNHNYIKIRNDWCSSYNRYTAEFNLSEARMFGTISETAGECFTIKTIKTKTKEMTLEEIEKKLGHKVKIVNK